MHRLLTCLILVAGMTQAGIVRDVRAAIARNGLAEGERLVTSNISTPMQGMKLRVAE